MQTAHFLHELHKFINIQGLLKLTSMKNLFLTFENQLMWNKKGSDYAPFFHYFMAFMLLLLNDLTNAESYPYVCAHALLVSQRLVRHLRQAR